MPVCWRFRVSRVSKRYFFPQLHFIRASSAYFLALVSLMYFVYALTKSVTCSYLGEIVIVSLFCISPISRAFFMNFQRVIFEVFEAFRSSSIVHMFWQVRMASILIPLFVMYSSLDCGALKIRSLSIEAWSVFAICGVICIPFLVLLMSPFFLMFVRVVDR